MIAPRFSVLVIVHVTWSPKSTENVWLVPAAPPLPESQDTLET